MTSGTQLVFKKGWGQMEGWFYPLCLRRNYREHDLGVMKQWFMPQFTKTLSSGWNWDSKISHEFREFKRISLSGAMLPESSESLKLLLREYEECCLGAVMLLGSSGQGISQVNVWLVGDRDRDMGLRFKPTILTSVHYMGRAWLNFERGMGNCRRMWTGREEEVRVVLELSGHSQNLH